MKKINKPTVAYIRPNEGYFEITDVKHRGKVHAYRLYDKMTEPMSQDRLAEFSSREKEKGNPYAISAPEFIAICDSAVESGNKGLMNHIFLCLMEGPNTLSRVIYNPSPLKDVSIHGYGMPDEYSLKGNIAGPDDWIKNLGDKESLELLMGIADIKRLNKISRGISHTQMHLWRLNSKPSKKDERAVRFYAIDERLDLYANRDPSIECPAFRVLQVA